MNTLVSLGVPLHNFERASTWMEKKSYHHPKITRSLHAEAKGFGSDSVSISKKESNNTTPGNQNSGSNDDDDDKIPEAVWDRMIVRILLSVGIPMGTGVALLGIFGVLKEKQIVDFPAWVPFFTTLLAFGTSTVGIAYGTLSTSLDPNKKGSVLGWHEVQQNWPEMWKEDDESKR